MAYSIGNSTVDRPLQPAPMAGVSDSPFRRICRRLGSPISIAEFIPARAVINNEVWAETALKFHPEERPFVYQIFGDQPAEMGRAAQILTRREPDAIELNSGCSVKKVAMTGAGAGLLRTPDVAAKIVDAMTKSTHLPITVKIRIGWDSNSFNYLDYTRRLIDAGAKVVTVHGRTRLQGYKGLADWQVIGHIKKEFSATPVVGNGDISNRPEGLARMNNLGLDGVAVGRAAQGNPWIFSNEGRPKSPVEILGVMVEHYRLMTNHYSPQRVALLFRKHAAAYFRTLSQFIDCATARSEFMQAKTHQDIKAAFNSLERLLPNIFNEESNYNSVQTGELVYGR